MSSTPVTERVRRSAASWLFGALSALSLTGCFDKGERWLGQAATAPVCAIGSKRCAPELESCVDSSDGAKWQQLDDCSSRGLICSTTLNACAVCEPNQSSCSGETVMQCDETGTVATPGETCDPKQRQVCREGSCVDLCSQASTQRSNVGCEYFGVDLDNAKIDDTLNAAAQQYAVVVSNPQADVTTDVTVEQDDSEPGRRTHPCPWPRPAFRP